LQTKMEQMLQSLLGMQTSQSIGRAQPWCAAALIRVALFDGVGVHDLL
jgi:hypothetical protein